jgi:hypothetical protein
MAGSGFGGDLLVRWELNPTAGSRKMRSGNITAALLFLLSTGVGAAGGGAPAIAALGDGATIGLGADPEKSRSR